MVKRNLINKKRGRPKGSKNKRKVLSAYASGTVSKIEIREAIHKAAVKEVVTSSIGGFEYDHARENNRYVLKSRIENNELDADYEYHFIYDLTRGAIYPEIIARFTVETEAKLCTEFLNGIRKISKKEYEKKRICIL